MLLLLYYLVPEMGTTDIPYRGRASRWPEATQTAVGPAKAIFWLALLASHNFVQALTFFIFVLIIISVDV